MKFKNNWNSKYVTEKVDVSENHDGSKMRNRTKQATIGLKNKKFMKWDKLLRKTKRTKPILINGNVMWGSTK